MQTNNSELPNVASKISSYEDAINALNKLQSNFDHTKKKVQTNSVNRMKEFIKRIGIEETQLDSLSVIHITGTKGKGTTCAYTESILRHHGFKTGFFSSPHLVTVVERIKINGESIAKNTFTKYYCDIHNSLIKTKSDEHKMPKYFQMLILVALKIFLGEGVDAAVIEVGIGGEYDSTNVFRKPLVIGITPIALDHTRILGNTVESIAWHKAGIMKPQCKAFTAPQKQEAIRVLKERSIERQSSFQIVNVNDCYEKYLREPHHIHNTNACLAVELAKQWMTLKNVKAFRMDKTITALSNCYWPGRYQVLHNDKTTFYIDGAHTVESIQICTNWFMQQTKNSNNLKILIFNSLGDRNYNEQLDILNEINFHKAFFVTNAPSHISTADMINYSITETVQFSKCLQLKDAWETLNNYEAQVFASETVDEVLKVVQNQAFDILVTGSLHLVGAVLSLIDTNFSL